MFHVFRLVGFSPLLVIHYDSFLIVHVLFSYFSMLDIYATQMASFGSLMILGIVLLKGYPRGVKKTPLNVSYETSKDLFESYALNTKLFITPRYTLCVTWCIRP